jgi:hypothetical protein
MYETGVKNLPFIGELIRAASAIHSLCLVKKISGRKLPEQR